MKGKIKLPLTYLVLQALLSTPRKMEDEMAEIGSDAAAKLCWCATCREGRAAKELAKLQEELYKEPSKKVDDAVADFLAGRGAFHEEQAQAKPEQPKTVPGILREGATTFEERNALYGDSYKGFGAVMKAIFPDGPPDFATVADWNRFGVFVMMASKLMRYSTNIAEGGHYDSALDLSVYSAMLAELTEEKK